MSVHTATQSIEFYEGQLVVVDDPDLAGLYALGAESIVARVGCYSMAGKILIATIDPSVPPGWERLIATTWYDPSVVRPAETLSQ